MEWSVEGKGRECMEIRDMRVDIYRERVRDAHPSCSSGGSRVVHRWSAIRLLGDLYAAWIGAGESGW